MNQNAVVGCTSPAARSSAGRDALPALEERRDRRARPARTRAAADGNSPRASWRRSSRSRDAASARRRAPPRPIASGTGARRSGSRRRRGAAGSSRRARGTGAGSETPVSRTTPARISSTTIRRACALDEHAVLRKERRIQVPEDGRECRAPGPTPPYRYPAEFSVARTTKRQKAEGRRQSALSNLLSGRAVDRGKRHIAQPEVDAQLAAVMDQVVHDEAAQHRNPRHRQDLLVALLQRPLAEHRGVGLGVDLLPSLLHVGVERREQVGASRRAVSGARRRRAWRGRTR